MDGDPAETDPEASGGQVPQGGHPKGRSASGSGPLCSYLVMPFMGTDLGKLMKHEKLSEDRIQFLVYQMLKGLKVGAAGQVGGLGALGSGTLTAAVSTVYPRRWHHPQGESWEWVLGVGAGHLCLSWKRPPWVVPGLWAPCALGPSFCSRT